jgi:two-component system nitrogen regulation sensor histidine kinase NtrY
VIRLGRFELRIVLALLLIAVIPLAASVFLVDQVMDASESIAAGESERRREALERARTAYADLFAARKQELKAHAAALAAQAPDDPERLRDWLTARIAADPSLKSALLDGPGGFRLDAPRPLPDEEFRELHLREDLRGRTVELTYVTPRAAFREFEALDRLQSAEVGLGILHGRLAGVLRTVFFGGLALVIALATLLGALLARRVTRRVLALSAATKRVAAGDLATRVDAVGKDEIADLGRAFNAMLEELSQSRERIAYLQKIGAWQEVARRLAHEIKNPLTPIQLAVQQLRTSYSPDTDPAGRERYARTLTEASDIVAEEIAGLRRLVEEFSAFAKLPRAELAATDAGALVEDFLRSYSSFDGRAEWAAPSGPILVAADKLLLRRALHNLVENALQAGAKRVWLSVEEREDRAAIVVADDGPGVPGELAERAFDPYVTTKEHGTGLGLAIVKKIVLEHGGAISLDERPGGGARFTVVMPIARV